MKSFREFITESRGDVSHPVLDRILSEVDSPEHVLDYFERHLGSDFLEFSRDSPEGRKIAHEFSPRGFKVNGKYKSFIGSRSGYQYYYYVVDHTDPRSLAVRSTDSNTWWIGQATLSKIDPSWAIDSLFKDF